MPVAKITTLPVPTMDFFRGQIVDRDDGGEKRTLTPTDSSTWERTVLSHGVTGSVYQGGGQVWGTGAPGETTPTGAAGSSTSTSTSTSGAGSRRKGMALVVCGGWLGLLATAAARTV